MKVLNASRLRIVAVMTSMVLVLAACTSGVGEEPSTDASKSAEDAVASASQMNENDINGDDYVPRSSSIWAYVPNSEEVSGFSSVNYSDMTTHITPDSSRVSGTVSQLEGLDPAKSQVFYLWEEGNVPGGTSAHGRDAEGFMPAVTTVPVAQGVPVKGAVLLEAGGAFQFRGARGDAYPTAEALSKRGYQCFVVDYRLTRDLGAIDLARSVRFVRAHWQEYGLPHENAIAVMGFSAGGIAAGQMLLDWDGTVSPSVYDDSYTPDVLDSVSADAAADGMIYSFYGQLSVASKDVEQLRAGNLPPTYFVYGSRDPFVREFEANVDALEKVGVQVEGVALRGWPHGFGAWGGWIEGYDEFLQRAFEAAR